MAYPTQVRPQVVNVGICLTLFLARQNATIYSISALPESGRDILLSVIS